MKKRLLLLLVLVLTAAATPVRAETLDDDTIRKIYAEIKGAIHDPDKTRALLEQRLDENYILKTEVTRQVGAQKPQVLSESRSKTEVIADTVKNMERMKMDQYDSNIATITYSADRKYAYVNDVTASTGTVAMPTKDGKSLNFAYTGKETCSHIVSLMGDDLKIMQAQCNDDITLRKQ